MELTYVMLAAIVVFGFFVWRSGRRQRRTMEEQQRRVVVGAQVVAFRGLFGTITHIDEEEHKVRLEVADGVELTVHARAVDTVISSPADEPGLNEAPVDVVDRVTDADDDADGTKPSEPTSDR